MTSVIQYLTTIHFGSQVTTKIGELLGEHKVTRPLLVTDKGIVAAGITDPLHNLLAATFDDVQTNPDESSVLRGVEIYREANCDGIIAVGGGSPIDCAKCIGLLATHAPPLEQYAVIRGGINKITSSKPPLIAVPTTSGTGSEVGRAALVTLTTGEKLGIISPHMIPTVAVCDPDLTLGLPPRLTAATGMDAISHCVETYCSHRFNPVADAIALDGLQRAVHSLQAAVEDGDEKEHREEMMMASLQGGLTFQKGLGMIHSLSHPLGGLAGKRLHHGMLNAIFLPHVLRYNAVACPEKMELIAVAIGATDAESVPEHFEKLIETIGLPTRLADLDVTHEDLAGIAAAAMKDHSTASNPREMTLADCEALLQAALE